MTNRAPDSPTPDTFVFRRDDWIRFQHLGRYGFDNEIIAGLMKHEIMPKGIRYKGGVFLPKIDIVTLINKMLKANLAVRDATDKLETVAKDALEAVESAE
jgi:hypothetical protein